MVRFLANILATNFRNVLPILVREFRQTGFAAKMPVCPENPRLGKNAAAGKVAGCAQGPVAAKPGLPQKCPVAPKTCPCPQNWLA